MLTKYPIQNTSKSAYAKAFALFFFATLLSKVGYNGAIMGTNISTLADLAIFAESEKERLVAGDKHAFLLTLSGELGAGKTAFTQALAKTFGVALPVTSPTFVLMNIYPLNTQKFERLVHIDAYRLHGGKELAPIGFHEIYKNSKNLIVLEWPEQVHDGLPLADRALTFTVSEERERYVQDTYGTEK